MQSFRMKRKKTEKKTHLWFLKHCVIFRELRFKNEYMYLMIELASWRSLIPMALDMSRFIWN